MRNGLERMKPHPSIRCRRTSRVVEVGVILALIFSASAPLRIRAETLKMTVRGTERTALVHLPAEAPNGELLPLVIAFHGSAWNGSVMEEITGLSSLSDEFGFIVAYPNGSGPAGALSWNTGACCSFALDRGVDDFAFADALLDALIVGYPVDPERIYATGFSNGGMLVHRLAVERPDRFSAVAVVAGALFPSQSAPGAPVPILIMHGTEDSIVPYDGGVGVLAGVSGKTEPSLSVSEAATLWKEANECSGETTVERERNARIESLGECASGAEVLLVTLLGGSHNWPTVQRTSTDYPVDETAEMLLLFSDPAGDEILWDLFESGIDASKTIWEFFDRN